MIDPKKLNIRLYQGAMSSAFGAAMGWLVFSWYTNRYDFVALLFSVGFVEFLYLVVFRKQIKQWLSK